MKLDKITLFDLYINKQLKTGDIGKIYGVHRVTIGKYLRKYGIPTRDGHFKKQLNIEPELLWSLYWGNQYSQTEIARIFGFTHAAILKEMRKFDIPSREYCESNKLSINEGKFKSGNIPYNKYLPPNEQSNWQGGKSFEPYGMEFNKKLRELIRKRDNNTCQECGYTQKQLGYKLNVHHIDYNKRNNSEDNLITLCDCCHGKTNFNRSDWVLYYKKKLNNVCY